MSYEPNWYIVIYEVKGKKDQKFIQAEDKYEAMSILSNGVPKANIKAVYVEVYDSEAEEEEEEYDE